MDFAQSTHRPAIPDGTKARSRIERTEYCCTQGLLKQLLERRSKSKPRHNKRPLLEKTVTAEASLMLELPDETSFARMVSFVAELKSTLATPYEQQKTLPANSGKEQPSVQQHYASTRGSDWVSAPSEIVDETALAQRKTLGRLLRTKAKKAESSVARLREVLRVRADEPVFLQPKLSLMSPHVGLAVCDVMFALPRDFVKPK